MLQSKDVKADQGWRSKELEQLHQSLEPNAGEVKLSAGVDISSEQAGSSKELEEELESLGLNIGEVKPFDREDSVEEVLSEQQLEDSESGDAPVVVKVKFGGFSKHFEDLGNQETAQDGLPGGESLQLPSFLVTEVQRSVKVANMMRKLANVSLNRTSSPLEHLPKCPILDIGRFEDASSSGESK